MRVSGDVRALAAVLTVLARVVPGGRNLVPILQGCRIGVDGESVEFVATDLDLIVRLRSAVLGAEGEGVVVLPVRYLADLCRHLEGEFVLDLNPEGAQLRCGRGKYQMNVLDPSSFPELPVPGEGLVVDFDYLDLRRMDNRVGFACARDMSRPALTGVLWEAGPEGLTAVSTDGTRMCVWEHSGQVFPEVRRVVIPARAFDVVSRMPQPGEGERVRVALGQTHIWFQTAVWAVGCRLLASPYPEWRQILPREFVTTFGAPLSAFRAAVERVALLGEAGDVRPVRLAFRPGVVELEASSPSVGRGHEEVDAEVQGSPLEVFFNAALLLQGLAALEGERVGGQFVGPQQASVWLDPADGAYRYLALPLKA